MDENTVRIKQEVDNAHSDGFGQTESDGESRKRGGEEQDSDDGSVNETSREGIVSFYENQNILDTYFDQSEAQELRDLGVSLVDANEVSNTIFEQVKSHFNESKRLKVRRAVRRIGVSFPNGESLFGMEDKPASTTSPVKAESADKDDSDSITRVGDSIPEVESESPPEPRTESVVELDSFVQQGFEVNDDIDLERYRNRINRNRSRRESSGEGENEAKFKIVKISKESQSNQLFIWDTIWNALYPHQKDGVLWMWELYCNNHGGILADEMGLGKSITAASFIAALFITFKRNQESFFQGDETCLPTGTGSKIKLESDTNVDVSLRLFKDEQREFGVKFETGVSCKKLEDGVWPGTLNSLSVGGGVDVASEPGFEASPCKMVLLVLPATLISHWIEVFNKWYYPIRVILFHGKGESERRDMFRRLRDIEKVSTELLVITTYETLRRNLQTLRQINWFYVILDEGHKIRNPDSGITLAVKSLGTCNRLLLSGSPIQNDLKELWSLIDFVYPGKLGTLPVFEQQFVLPIKQAELRNAAMVQTMRALNCTRILQELIKACILRRRKHELQDVLKLPSQAEHVLFCSLTPIQYEVYCSCLDLLQARQLTKSKMHGVTKYFALLNILREACNHPELLKLVRRQNKDGNMDSDVDFFDDQEDEFGSSGEMQWNRRSALRSRRGRLDTAEISEEGDHLPSESSGQRFINVNGRDSGKYQALMSILKLWRDKKEHRVLIFTQGVRTLKLLSVLLERDLGLRYGRDMLTLDGSTPLNTRFSLVKRFNQDSSIFLFILTSRVGGVGLNIIGANRVILYDPWWNPMTDTQAKERCWRIGQKREVIVYRLITRDTIEERIFQRQLFKEFIAKQILKDPKSQTSMSWTNLNELVRKPRKPRNFVSNPRLASEYVRNIRNIWGGKTRQRKDGNTYSRYFDELDLPERTNHDGFDDGDGLGSRGSSSRKEIINDELNLFGEITFDARSEHNAIMSILGDNNDDDNLVSSSIGSSSYCNPSPNSRRGGGTSGSSNPYLHDDLAEATDEIIRTSVKLIKQSEIERGNYDYNVPTWTGKSGQAGAPSSFILRNLKRQKVSQGRGGGALCGNEEAQQVSGWDEASIRRRLTDYFLKRERLGIKTSTEDLLGSFGELIPDSSHGLFKKVLKQICTLIKSNSESSRHNYWVLKKRTA